MILNFIKKLRFKSCFTGRRPSKSFILKTGVAFIFGYTFFQIAIHSGYRLGLDIQPLFGMPSCSDYFVYFMVLNKNIVPKRGDYVVASMPEHNLKAGPPIGRAIVKKVAAVPGDWVQIDGTELYINGFHVDRLWLAKSIPEKQPGDFDRKITLAEGEYFLMGSTQESFDSRYWGPISDKAIRGYAYPLF